MSMFTPDPAPQAHHAPQTPVIRGVVSTVEEFKTYGPEDYMTIVDAAVFFDSHTSSIHSMIDKGLLIAGEKPKTVTCQSMRWLWQNRSSAGRLSRKGRPATWTAPEWEPWCSLGRQRYAEATGLRASATNMEPLACAADGLGTAAATLGITEAEIVKNIANREWGICAGLLDLVSPLKHFIVPWAELMRVRNNQVGAVSRKITIIKLDPGDRLLDITEVSKALDVARVTVYKWITQRVFPIHHIGREIRIKRSDLLEYIQKRRATFKSGRFNERLTADFCKPDWVMPDWL